MVDNRTNITPAGKIKGQALQLVQGLPVTTENYSIARNLLADGYENKKLIAATYVRQILGLKSISKEDVGETRQLVDTFCSNLNALKALNIDHRLENIILSQLVVQRLYSQTRWQWQMKQAGEAFPSLNIWIIFMEQECQVLETLKPSNNIANVKEIKAR